MAADQEQRVDSSPTPPPPAAAVDLDLAFAADGAFAPGLVQAAGAWADPLDGAEHWHGLLETWLTQLAAELPPELRAPSYSLGLSLVGDAEIAALNADWRQQEGPTDVLAFAAQDDDLDGAPPMPLPAQDGDADGDDSDEDGSDGDGWEGEPLELGDIVISLEAAARQAPEHGHDLERELLFLASHGLLHLLGWDHPDEASLAAMLERQERLLAAG
ncbi:rRNA maturation RNase YbeY [Vulcanococcus limneticus]|uniref:rRNA maturation RNase YbeY n=1 Tax=Vulcanococcus limneticus TaxID=2170428 RepID=UPI00398C04A5